MSKSHECETLIWRVHHNVRGHLREQKMLEVLRLRFWQKSMQTDIVKILKKYKEYNKMAWNQQYQPFKPLETLYPFESVSLDTGKFMYASGKIDIFLVDIDHFTKYMEMKIIPQKMLLVIESFVQEFILN